MQNAVIYREGDVIVVKSGTGYYLFRPGKEGPTRHTSLKAAVRAASVSERLRIQ